MKYKKKEIGTPTIEQIQECERIYDYKYNAYDCYAYFKAKDWKTKAGKDFETLESACSVYNGVHVARLRKTVKEENFNDLTYEHSPYKEQLKDTRWRLFREFAIYTRGGVCENCGSKKNLVIHHPKYISGYNAWDYSVRDVVCLCKGCHNKLHGITDK